VTDKRRQLLTYSVCGIAVIWAAFNFEFGPPKSPNQPNAVLATIIPISDQAGKKADDLLAAKLDELHMRNWGMDPFRSGFRAFALEPTDPLQTVKKPQWIVNGILYTASSPIAYINQKPVKVGDHVHNARVLEIGKKDVVLEFEGRRIRLSVNQG